MIEVKYVSGANGTELNLIGDKLRATDGYVHTRSWSPVTLSRLIGANLRYFKKEPKAYDITVTLRGDLNERYAMLDRLTDVFDGDIKSKKIGKLWFGDYYLKCYAIDSEVKVNSDLNSRTDVKITFWAPYPEWVKEHEINLGKDESSGEIVGGLDYAPDRTGRRLANTWWALDYDSQHSGLWLRHGDDIEGTMYEYEINVGGTITNDTGKFLICYVFYLPRNEEDWEEPVREYFNLEAGESRLLTHHCYIVCDAPAVTVSQPTRSWEFNYDYDFGSTTSSRKEMQFDGSTDVNFRMVIHGAAVNPTININGHIYQVNTSINDGEYIVIDSVERTVTLYSGIAEINLFDLRYKQSDIFEPIDATEMTVNWGGSYEVDLILYLERSEPRWVTS